MSKTRIRTGTWSNVALDRPFDPDATKVEAKFDKGVLRIRLPKPADVARKQQKIEIKKD